MSAKRVNRAMLAGRRAASRTEAALAHQYEQVVRAAARRASREYVAASSVTLAASPPPLSQVVQEGPLVESAIARTTAQRRRMAKAAVEAAVKEEPARKEILAAMEQITKAQAGRQAARLYAGVRDAVAHVILESQASGWTVPETAAQIREVVSGNASWQATMLARTDLVATSNSASLQSALSLGDAAPQFKTWLATSDDRTRETHAEADGQVVPIEAAFEVGDGVLNYPGDPEGPDGETINCRCTLIYSDEAVQSPEETALAAAAILQQIEGEEAAMPWQVKEGYEGCDGFAVVKESDGSVSGCHGTRGEAEAQMRALYVNEEGMSASIALSAWDAAMVAAEFTAEERRSYAEDGIALPDGSYPIPDTEYLRKAIDSLGRAAQNDEYDRVRRHIIKRARALDATDMLPEDWNVTAATLAEQEDETQSEGNARYAKELGESMCASCGATMAAADSFCASCGARREGMAAAVTVVAHHVIHNETTGEVIHAGDDGIIVADCGCGIDDQSVVTASVAAPEYAPAEWFDDPQLTEPTPLTVTEDGRVFGHLARWDQCHTGFQDRCVTPPRGLSYDYFNIGALETADGETVKVGKITLATGHADITASRAQAVAHYDNTGTVGAYVRAGEDEHGPWLAGAVKSDATPEQIRDLRANGPSGDWRLVRAAGKSALELVGVLSVPVQGFPIALRASAHQGEAVVALIAGAAYDAPEDDDDGAAEKLEELSREIGVIAAPPVMDVRRPFADSPTQIINLTVNVGQSDEEEEPEESDGIYSRDMDREIAYQVAFFTDKGYWPSSPLSGAEFTEEQWEVIQTAAPLLVTDPDSPGSEMLRARILAEGFLVT